MLESSVRPWIKFNSQLSCCAFFFQLNVLVTTKGPRADFSPLPELYKYLEPWSQHGPLVLVHFLRESRQLGMSLLGLGSHILIADSEFYLVVVKLLAMSSRFSLNLGPRRGSWVTKSKDTGKSLLT